VPDARLAFPAEHDGSATAGAREEAVARALLPKKPGCDPWQGQLK